MNGRTVFSNGSYESVTPDPVLSVIIVNWNTRGHLSRCLASLRNCAPRFAVETIVVDNSSSDGSAEYVRTDWPETVLIANSSNKGFAGGVNDGLRAARAKHLLVMNPDIQVHAGCLDRLVGFAEGHPDAGAVMPELRGPDGIPQTNYIRLIPGIGQVLWFHTVLDTIARKVPFLVRTLLEADVPPGASAVDVAQIPGAVLLTRRDVVQSVGMMDEGFKLFYEDVDWCFRIKQKGWRLVLDREASVTHAGGGSFGGDTRTWLTGRFVLSLMRFFDCHQSRAASLLVRAILLSNSAAVVLSRSVQIALLGSDPRGNRHFSRARHMDVLKLYYCIYIAHSDPGLSPTPGNERND